MSLSAAIVVSSVLTLAFAIAYVEWKSKALKEMAMARDECLRFALLVAAHRAQDRPLVEEIESFVSEEDDEVSIKARRAAIEMAAKESEAEEAA